MLITTLPGGASKPLAYRPEWYAVLGLLINSDRIVFTRF
jgi:hypothetical protein